MNMQFTEETIRVAIGEMLSSDVRFPFLCAHEDADEYWDYWCALPRLTGKGTLEQPTEKTLTYYHNYSQPKSRIAAGYLIIEFYQSTELFSKVVQIDLGMRYSSDCK